MTAPTTMIATIMPIMPGNKYKSAIVCAGVGPGVAVAAGVAA